MKSFLVSNKWTFIYFAIVCAKELKCMTMTIPGGIVKGEEDAESIIKGYLLRSSDKIAIFNRLGLHAFSI